jgi:predicted DCC family thiol-disulfide oxidoreductase YuxK
MTATPILYDPDCGFCRVCVAVVLTWDRAGRLVPVPLGSPEANDLLRGMPEAEQWASWHLLEPGWQGNVAENATNPCHPEIRSAGAGFSVLFRLLPGGTPFALVAERFPDAADRAYRWVADRRGAFGRVVPRPVRRWADRVIQVSESAPDSR